MANYSDEDLTEAPDSTAKEKEQDIRKLKLFYSDYVVRSHNEYLNSLNNSNDENIIYYGLIACLFANHTADHIGILFNGNNYYINRHIGKIEISNNNFRAVLNSSWPAFKIVANCANALKHRKARSSSQQKEIKQKKLDPNTGPCDVSLGAMTPDVLLPTVDEPKKGLYYITQDKEEIDVTPHLEEVINNWRIFLHPEKQQTVT